MKRNTWVAVAAGIVVAGFLLFGGNVMQMFRSVERSVPEPIMQTEQNNINTERELPTTGFQFEDTVVGTGAEAKAGSLITVHYTGVLSNGMKFDSSVDRGQPFQFRLGEGMVIRGWEEGFSGMKVGGKRTLIIAPDYGYGSQQVGPIPANSVLIFDVELLAVE